MKLADLSSEAIAKIKTVRWDRIIEKHEGPENWEAILRYYNPEFLMIEGRPVLLPIEQTHYANITILRTIFSAHGKSLTLFLEKPSFWRCSITNDLLSSPIQSLRRKLKLFLAHTIFSFPGVLDV